MEGQLLNSLEKLHDLSLDHFSPDCYDCLTDCYRLCRNMLALDPTNQQAVHKSELVSKTRTVFKLVTANTMEKTENVLVLLRCGVQFMGNYCSGNPPNQQHIWEEFCDIFR